MLDSLYVGATGLQATQQRIDAISNNLSNVATPAFKKARVMFDDVLYRNLSPVSGPQGLAPSLEQGVLGTGTRVARIDRFFTQGALQTTQRPLDLSIQGRGFFEIERADGTLVYSRGGAFVTNDAGEIVTADGHRPHGAAG